MTLASILATSTVAMGTPLASLLVPSGPRGTREPPSARMWLSSQFSLIILTHVSLMSVMVTLTALRRCFAHWRPIIPERVRQLKHQAVWYWFVFQWSSVCFTAVLLIHEIIILSPVAPKASRHSSGFLSSARTASEQNTSCLKHTHKQTETHSA